MIIGKWVGEFDRAQAKRVLSGDDPFNERTMLDNDETPHERAVTNDKAEPAVVREAVPV